MENSNYLSCYTACSRQLICAFDTKQHANLPINQQTRSGSAKLVVSCSLDSIVYPILMGIASYLALMSEKPNRTALTVYVIQLVFNFFWSIIFFNLGLYLFAFIWLVLLWLLILKTTILFYQISKPAGYLMFPYLLWVTFAGYLNFSIYLLN